MLWIGLTGIIKTTCLYNSPVVGTPTDVWDLCPSQLTLPEPTLQTAITSMQQEALAGTRSRREVSFQNRSQSLQKFRSPRSRSQVSSSFQLSDHSGQLAADIPWFCFVLLKLFLDSMQRLLLLYMYILPNYFF